METDNRQPYHQVQLFVKSCTSRSMVVSPLRIHRLTLFKFIRFKFLVIEYLTNNSSRPRKHKKQKTQNTNNFRPICIAWKPMYLRVIMKNALALDNSDFMTYKLNYLVFQIQEHVPTIIRWSMSVKICLMLQKFRILLIYNASFDS